MSAKPTYVSSSGSLTSRPLTVRIKDYASSWYLMFYLFWQTLLMPMINTASFADPNIRPQPKRDTKASGGAGSSWGGGGGGGGGGGSGGGGSGGGGNGGGWPRPGGGFRTMGDLQGGGTVDGCRATCG